MPPTNQRIFWCLLFHAKRYRYIICLCTTPPPPRPHQKAHVLPTHPTHVKKISRSLKPPSSPNAKKKHVRSTHCPPRHSPTLQKTITYLQPPPPSAARYKNKYVRTCSHHSYHHHHHYHQKTPPNYVICVLSAVSIMYNKKTKNTSCYATPVL